MYLKIFIGILSLQTIGSLAFANLQKNDIQRKVIDIERNTKNNGTYN